MTSNINVNSVKLGTSPSEPNHTATKQYVDMKTKEITGGDDISETLDTLGKISNFLGDTTELSTSVVNLIEEGEKERDRLQIELDKLISDRKSMIEGIYNELEQLRSSF